jgi:surfactin synthase thioesterase subunit
VAPLLDRPVAVFGHSMGAALGFELALRLEAAGRRLRRLFVSGRRGPSAYRDECFHRLDDPALVAELRRLNGTDSAILGDTEMLAMILPTVRGDLTAIETYRCAPGSSLGCPITVMVGDNDPRTTVDEARSWAGHTTAGSELFVLPGGHFYLVGQATEVIDIVAARLAEKPPAA